MLQATRHTRHSRARCRALYLASIIAAVTLAGVCTAENILRSIEVTEKAALTFAFDGELQPEIEIGLFGNIVPHGVDFFKSMCTKDVGKGSIVDYTPVVQSILKVVYIMEGNMTKSHIVPQKSVQMEQSSVPHDQFAFGVGVNADDKGYRFYITLGQNSHMNTNKYIVLGRVMTQKRQLMKYSEVYFQPVQVSEDLLTPEEIKKQRKKKKKEKAKPKLELAKCRLLGPVGKRAQEGDQSASEQVEIKPEL